MNIIQVKKLFEDSQSFETCQCNRIIFEKYITDNQGHFYSMCQLVQSEECLCSYLGFHELETPNNQSSGQNFEGHKKCHNLENKHFDPNR